jgi:hypothetical protein
VFFFLFFPSNLLVFSENMPFHRFGNSNLPCNEMQKQPKKLGQKNGVEYSHVNGKKAGNRRRKYPTGNIPNIDWGAISWASVP